MGMLDKFDSELANELSICITKNPTLFENDMVGIFDIIDITNDHLLGSYGSCPAKENPSVVNVNYEGYKTEPKRQASKFQTLFYIDIKMSLLLLVENRNVVGLKANLEQLLAIRDIKIVPIYYKNWKDRILREIQNIASVELKHKDPSYSPPIKNLDQTKVAFVCNRFKIKCKPKEFVEFALDNADDFEVLKIKANNKTYNFIDKSLKAVKKQILNTSCFSNAEQYKDELIALFSNLCDSISLDGNVLLE